jgi:hypothetical protein
VADGRRPLLPYFIGLPRRPDLTPQRHDHVFAFRNRQIRPIAFGEQRCDAVVLVDQRAPGHFRRVSREHELDAKLAERVMKAIPADAVCRQAPERLLARSALRR